jgi:2-C-methyl-D-erythritol 4-phosphate cytidylyltransferase
MTHALIFAGGTGQRMNTRAKPKQFLELRGKPIIIYTLEHFDAHPLIDDIVVVCVESWIRSFGAMLMRYAVGKVSAVVPGGEGGDISIHNGLKAMEGKCAPDDIVLIHDGVRPLINAELISENIRAARKHGSAITVEQATESVVRMGGDGRITDVPPRAEMGTAKAPQSFRYGMIWDLYSRARKDGVRSIDSAHLCSIYGTEVYAVKSTPNNMKITAPPDFHIFRALYEATENGRIPDPDGLECGTQSREPETGNSESGTG